MRKIEINNEIVRMRHVVRQARVCIINKLIREAKALRTKNGTEKQKEKNKRKADKLINEIYALKKIKDDRITKFGITNTKTLKEILEGKNVRDSTRIIARVANYKTLKSAIVQFRETYPDYEEYLQPKKAKSAKPKDKSKQKTRNEGSGMQTRSTNRNAPSTSASGSFMQDESNLSDDSDNSNGEGNVIQSDLQAGSILRIKTASCAQTKQKESKYSKKDKGNSVSSEEETTDESIKNIKRSKVTGISIEDGKQEAIKIVSKEATVKRFTELIQEKNTDENTETQHEPSIKYESTLQKKVDEFFMSGDGNVYLSTAAAIVHDTENNMSEDEDLAPAKKSEEFLAKTSFENNKFYNNNAKNYDARYEKPRRKKYEYKEDHLNRNRDQTPFDTKGKYKTFSKQKFKSNDVRRSNDVENLHPSWAARKKQQEIMKTAFQGKKIVFDDV